MWTPFHVNPHQQKISPPLLSDLCKIRMKSLKKKDLKLKRRLDVSVYEDKKGKRSLPITEFLPAKKPVTKSPLQEETESKHTELSTTEQVQNELFPPLPKSQIVPIDKAKPISKPSGLPPPDMEYLTRKHPIPLKWTPPHQCSGFVLEDNTVMFIGTRHCEEAIRKSFINFLLGREEDDNGSYSDIPMDGIQSDNMLNTARNRNDVNTAEESSSKKLLSSDESGLIRPTSTLLQGTSGISSSKSEILAITSSDTSVTSRESRPVRDEPTVLAQTCDDPGRPHDTQTELREEEYEVYDTSLDEQLLQDPQVLKDFMGDGDISSDDSDLPRVNVTGRYPERNKTAQSKVQTGAQVKPHSAASRNRASADAIRPSWRKEETSFNSGATNKRSEEASVSEPSWRNDRTSFSRGAGSDSGAANVSGPGPSWRSDQTSFNSGPSTHGSEWRNDEASIGGVAGTVESCPICHASFPPGYPQYSADEHIAMCLAVNFE